MIYDVAIIGAGVIGALTAREFSRFKLNVALLEAENDVAMGATKANSGLVHAGYDAEPGSLMAKLNVEGNAMMGDLAAELQKKAHCVVLFGEAAGLIEHALKEAQTPAGPKVIRCGGLEEAVKAAARECRPGDVVLLSPGGTSYDAFVNFEERGDKFTEWVKALE